MKKRDLLKEIGWNDELIKHFMVDDIPCETETEENMSIPVQDTSTMTFTYNSGMINDVLYV